MPITLAEAQELSRSALQKQVITEFRKSPILDTLIFDNTIRPSDGSSLAYTYGRVKTLATASGRLINHEYTPQEAKAELVTAHLKVFGGAFEVDRVLAAYEQQLIDHVQFQFDQKTQATRASFADMFINGDSAIDDGIAFDGLDKIITGASTEVIPSAAIELDTSAHITANWQEFLDLFDLARGKMDGAPTLHLVNSIMFARFQSVMKRAGINLASKDNYGDEVVQYGKTLVMSMGDKPGSANPIIPIEDGETAIYSVRIGLDGVHGISPDGTPLVKAFAPDFTTPGAVKRGEVEMIAAIVAKTSRCASVVRRIKVQ